MAYTYPVKWITSGMRGAPVVSGTAGTFIAALDAFLNTGWGSANAISVTISGGVGTAVFPEGVYFEDHAVVLFGGATTPAELNGEARVLSHTNNSITFGTDAPDGTATGTTITCRYAPVGNWSKPFTGTNKAVFRSTDVQANGHYLRADDSGATFARVVGYESMTDVDTGTGPFPTAVQVSGGGYVLKSTAANTNAVRYAMAADSRSVLWAVEPGTSSNASLRTSNARGFGDLVAMAPSGDVWSSFLSCLATSGTSNFDYGALSGGPSSTTTQGLTVCPRAFSALGGASLVNIQPITGLSTELSGASTVLGTAPSTVGGKILLTRLFARSQTAAEGPRAYVPGLTFVPQSGLAALLNPHDTLLGSGEWGGRTLLAIGVSNNANGVPVGISLIDLTGPWR